MSFSPAFLSWLESGSEKCLLAEVSVRVGGVETTRYLSSTGYVSGTADTPANTIYQGRITGGFSFARSLSLSGGGAISFGSLDLDNIDGALDGWLQDIWALRQIKLFLGSPNWVRSDFVQVFSGTVEDITPRDRDTLSLKLRDVLASLNAPISTAVLGGSSDMKDALLPLALGEVFNVEPLLTSTTGSQIYQVSLGAVEDVLEVRDNGYPVSISKNNAAGTFTLTAQRYGQITCDVQGAKLSGEYRNDVGGMIAWLGTTLGDGNKLTLPDFDTAALSAFRAANTQPVGVWVSDRMNRLALMQELAASLGATVTATPLGLVQIVKLAFGTPTRSITQYNMVDRSFAPSGRPDVQGAVQLAGCRNWFPQEKSGLAASLSTESLSLLSDEYVSVTAQDATVLANYKQSAPEAESTYLVVESDLSAEATRRLNIWKQPRTIFKFEGFAEMLDLELGETVTITHPRLGLSAGATALVIGLQADFVTARVTVEVLV